MAQRVKINRTWKGSPAGTVLVVSNNEAHEIIENGIGVIVFNVRGEDKMLTPNRKLSKIQTK